MNNRKIAILAAIGAVFFAAGLYLGNSSYEYLGIGTWLSGIIYYTLFRDYKEVTSLILGLIILHTGVILLLAEKLTHPKLLGFLVFTAGIIVVLNSGFSDYLKRRKSKK
ncbi:MAG: hypothetical protein O8C64_14925 [Candidatus Methanoperedens sp.]|nr:hypothetical protein [Candidatus Methanoperedens sp.]MCZ7405360.1 hypothetical protein [Candidatus Methanoperedens sp.]